MHLVFLGAATGRMFRCFPTIRMLPTAVLTTTISVAALWPVAALAVTPDSPEVKELVDRGLKWLEAQPPHDILGGKCLAGLAFYKAGRPVSHPVVVAATNACRSATLTDQFAVDNYSLGIAVVFLLETGVDRNRSLAQRYVDEVLKRQQKGGAWGYPEGQVGDTSQTQYATLALWIAAGSGIDIPITTIEKDCDWLLRTQDPSGGFGYHPQDPGTYNRVRQEEIRPALVAGAIGSLYICSDLFVAPETKQTTESKVPSALKAVGESLAPKRRPSSHTIDPKFIRRGLDDGNQWFSRHYTLEQEHHAYYYLYAYERYQSFREFSEKREDPNPKWYDDIVKRLTKTREAEGFWEDQADGAAVSTSFAILTLMRSTKKTLAAVAALPLGAGVLLGGRGLPAKTSDLQERDGKIVESPLAGTLNELLTMLENGQAADLERLSASTATMTLDSDVTKRSGELNRLRSLVSTGDFHARFGAVRVLARVREFDNVPILIYAMTDPDLRIVKEADKGLRFISRKFEGVGLKDEPSPTDIKSAIAAWKAWYQTIRPNAQFLD